MKISQKTIHCITPWHTQALIFRKNSGNNILDYTKDNRGRNTLNTNTLHILRRAFQPANVRLNN